MNLVELLDMVRPLLADDGLELGESQVALLQRHVELIREWNRVVGVVSAAEVEFLWERHVADSLSLAAVVNRLGIGSGHLLDIGSGGGFPAIPMLVVLPGLRGKLIERSEKKVGFLRKVIGALRLGNATVVAGEFSWERVGNDPAVITARAAENPERLAARIVRAMAPASVFLCQSGARFESGVTVERVEDRWTTAGLRRGTLDLVRRMG